MLKKYPHRAGIEIKLQTLSSRIPPVQAATVASDLY
jgi:hypothetical protein